MKKQLKIMVVIMALVSVFAMATSAMAWEGTCTITQTGQFWDQLYVYLTDTAATPAFTNRAFIIPRSGLPATFPADFDKKVLATALTAQANAKKVRVLTTASTEWSLVVGLKMLNE